jgi:hypothetical protein
MNPMKKPRKVLNELEANELALKMTSDGGLMD